MDYISLGSLLIGAAALIIGYRQVYYARKQLEQNRQKAFEWRDVEIGALSLFGKIEEEISPAAILCLNERAAIPMGIGLAEAVARDVPVFVGLYDGTRGVDIDASAYYEVNTGRTGILHLPRAISYYKNKKLLVFAAYVHTGHTMIQVRDFLRAEGFEHLCCVALVAQRTSTKSLTCDFVHFYTENADFRFPWGIPP